MENLYDISFMSTLTASSKPILFGDKLKPAIRLNAVESDSSNRQEIHESVHLKSKLYVNRKEQPVKGAEDLIILIKQGLSKPENIGLSYLVMDEIKGWIWSSGITDFKSVGLALDDIGSGSRSL
jgi:alanine dehydrogenase